MRCGSPCGCCSNPSKSSNGQAHTSPTSSTQKLGSLRSLIQGSSASFATPLSSSGELVDDPETYYGSARGLQSDNRASRLGGMYVKPEHSRGFDPSVFKRRIASENDDAVNQGLGGGLETKPLLTPSTRRGGVEVEPVYDGDSEDLVVETKREKRRKKKKHDRGDDVEYAEAKRERAKQRAVWRFLVLAMLGVILIAGIVLGSGLHFKFGSDDHGTNAKDSVDDEIQTDAVSRTTNDEAALAAIDPTDAELQTRYADMDEDVSEIDPTDRTFSPKEWKAHSDLLRKIKRDAKAAAKKSVQMFVESAHSELGVDDVDEYDESNEGDPNRVAKKTNEATKSNDGSADEVLAASEASVLAHGLLADAVNSKNVFASSLAPKSKSVAATGAATDSSAATGAATDSSVAVVTQLAIEDTDPKKSAVPEHPLVATVEKTSVSSIAPKVQGLTEGSLSIPGLTDNPEPEEKHGTETQRLEDATESPPEPAKFGLEDMIVGHDAKSLSELIVAPSSLPRRALR